MLSSRIPSFSPRGRFEILHIGIVRMGFTRRVRFILEEMNSTPSHSGTNNKEKSRIRKMGNKDRRIFQGPLTVPVYMTT